MLMSPRRHRKLLQGASARGGEGGCCLRGERELLRPGWVWPRKVGCHQCREDGPAAPHPRGLTCRLQATAMHQTEARVKNLPDKCMGQLERVPAPLAEYNLPPLFGLQHSSAQYVSLCTALLAAQK